MKYMVHMNVKAGPYQMESWSKEDVKRIADAAPVGAAAGTRYPADGMKRVYI